MRIKTITYRTRYWRPGTDYLTQITNTVKKQVLDGDIIAISEKAISTATGNLIDEDKIKPGILAEFLAKTWTKKIWVKILGKICGLKKQTIDNLRNYPEYEGSRHKQVALRHAGFLQSLRHYSEGGIDASNLPYAYVSLPLKNPERVAEKIRKSFSEHFFSVGEESFRVTCSAGVAEHRRGEDSKSIIKRADIGLYQAKSMGRNLVRTG